MPAGPAGTQAAPGLQAAPMRSASAAGAANFQSSWQSLLASLGAELGSAAAQSPEPGAVQNNTLELADAKNPQPPMNSDAVMDSSEISQTRVHPDPLALLRRETAASASAEEDAVSSETAHTTTTQGTESSGKPAKRETNLEKKPAVQSASALTASLTAATSISLGDLGSTETGWEADRWVFKIVHSGVRKTDLEIVDEVIGYWSKFLLKHGIG